MTQYQWFIFFLIIQIVHYIGTWKLYENAGRKSWEAAIPIYNAIVLMKIINRPTWWTILLFVPIINIIMIPVIWVETLRSFGKNSTSDTYLGLFSLGFYIYYVNYTQNVSHIKNRSLIATTALGDFVSSIVFAVVVATLVHTYILQPFVIPSASLEKSLLIGDFLFVSKLNYGARPQMTAVALPMIHDSIPFTKKTSYFNFPQYPYFRFPGFEKIQKNDIVVFNWPCDTVYRFFEKTGKKGVTKPIDKKSNYVKRCQGTPGDSLSLKNGIVYINNHELILPERAKPQYQHKVYAVKGVSNELLLATGSTEFNRNYTIKISSDAQATAIQPYVTNGQENPDKSYTISTGFQGIPSNIITTTGLYAQEIYGAVADVNLTLKAAENLRKNTEIDSVVRYIAKKPTDSSIFPHDGKWTIDNFGPIYIPEAGHTVAINIKNLPLYQRIIQTYEQNHLQIKGNQIWINNQIATKYTFKQNYYWMMGDNRHRSEDSRYWGFVPEDHIVGKPVFIWFSYDQNESWKHIFKKIRWSRMFTFVSGTGEPTSYFNYFVIALLAYFGINYFVSKKKEK